VHDAFELLAAATAARRQGQLHAEAESRLEAAFGCSRRLVVYGTLAPGEANERQLTPCPGTWTPGTVTGWRAQRAHPVFTFDPAAPPVRMLVLQSDALPAHWARLDAFEGEHYRRILVPVAGADACTVANLFEAVAPVRG
jgi:gamma-glutamylcyclotransferase (GGCT)/AIG2-like uncharacterized protein YtfP